MIIAHILIYILIFYCITYTANHSYGEVKDDYIILFLIFLISVNTLILLSY